MKNNKWSLCLVAFTMLCLLPALATRAGAEEESVTDQEKRLVASVGEDGIQRVEVSGGEYYFEPNYIVVQINKPVELSIRKVDGFIPHNIIVKAPDAGINFDVVIKKEFQPIRFKTLPGAGDYWQPVERPG